jgi:hypothetical protein
MAIGDIYQVTLTQMCLGQQCDAVFHYEQKDIIVTLPTLINESEALANWFISDVLPKINNVQAAGVTNVSVGVKNLFDAADADTKVVTGGGDGDTGDVDQMPPFNAYDYALTGAGNAVHNARKRLVGLVEGNQTAAVLINKDSSFSRQDELSTALEAKFMSALGLSVLMEPVVVKRVKEVVGGKTKYRLPTVIGEKVVKIITIVVWKSIVGHQVTRSFGRGA